MTKKLKVVVLMGGKSSEHDVSISSGNEVVKRLDKTIYEVEPFVIPRSGSGIEKIIKMNPDVVYIALHGLYGEDGTIQGMLELFGIPYTGPGVLASSVGMDKIIFRKLMIAEKIPVPEFTTFQKNEDVNNIFSVLGKLPYFIKPYDQGSSVGASVVKNDYDLKPALDLALNYSRIALVDEFIAGTELTCAVLGNENPFALPVVEIVALKGKFFDYESKYSDNGAKEIVPARLSGNITKEVQDLAIKVYKAIGCRGVSRVDFILKDNKTPIVLEINTCPGLTPASLLPKAAKAAGIEYSDLLDKIINYAIEKN